MTEPSILFQFQITKETSACVQNADLKLLVFDASQADIDAHSLQLIDENALVVLNKCDLKHADLGMDQGIEISVKTEDGLGALLSQMEERIADLIGVQETPALTRERHRVALQDCQAALKRSLLGAMPELVAEDLRLAIRHLGRITGRVDVEDLLDVVFNDFCIGK